MKYILFDLDGTLTEPKEGITNSIKYAISKFGMKGYSTEDLVKYIGPPLRETFSKGFGLNEEDSLLAVEKYREYFSSKGIFENKVYDGVLELLDELYDKGKVIILATSKPRVYAKAILEHFGIIKYFIFVSGSELDGTRDNKDEVISYALQENNIDDLSDVIMIGDRKHDILGAKKVGIKSVGVLFGYGKEDELKKAGADYLAKDFNDLKEIIL